MSSTTRYIYDGMRVIQERNASNTPLVAYTRGQDLSGTFEGAGGIGGLLERSSGYSGGSWPTHYFYHADGNGNVTYLATTLLGTAASYRYDPYGNTISATDSIGNVYRFSSKEQHLNSGFYYYGYRFYAPSLQRWPNRDPLDEEFDYNLYRFAYNSPVEWIDAEGEGAIPIQLPNIPFPILVEAGAAAAAAGGTLCVVGGAVVVVGGIVIAVDQAPCAKNYAPEGLSTVNSPSMFVCNAEHTKGARPSTAGKHQKGMREKARKRWDKKRSHPGWKNVPKRVELHS